jgi:NAD-dependent deacetylase
MKNIVVFSGAGLSKESGIPTFRDSKDGLWHNHKVEDVATPEGWAANPQLVLEFYQHRWKNIQDCQPNEAHKAIVRLQEKYNVINITQNIDDLLERAGCHQIWHLHGTILERKCEYHKSTGHPDHACLYLERHDHPAEWGEKCPACGGQTRPNVVWFGEEVDMKDAWLNDLVKRTYAFIGVGTSAQVQPAAGLLYHFRNVPMKYFIDPQPPLRLQSFTRLAGTATEHLPKVVDDLLAAEDEAAQIF